MHTTIIVIICIYIAAILGVGFYFRKRSGTSEEFYVAGRSIGPWVHLLAYFSTFISAGAFVGYASTTYLGGIPIFWSWPFLGIGIAIIWGLVGPKLFKVSRNINALTITDYVQDRFNNKAVSVLLCINMVIFLIPMCVAQFKAAGILVEMVSGIPYRWAIIIFGLVAFLYVSLGGMYSVLYTDCIQGGLMIFSAIILIPVVYFATQKFGGFAEYANLNPAGFSLLPGAGSKMPLSFLIPWILLSFWGALGSPHYAVRFYTIKNYSTIKKMMPLAVLLGAVMMGVVTQFLGIGGRVLYPELQQTDQTTILIIRDLFPSVVSGIVLAGLAAAMMSSIDAMIITIVSTVENDLLKKTLNVKLTDKKRVWVARIVTVITGIIITVWGLFPPKLLALLFYPAWGALGFVCAFLFYGGLYWKRMNWQGALVATLFPPIITIVWTVAKNPFGMREILASMLISIPLFFIVTLLSPKPPNEIVARYFNNDLRYKFVSSKAEKVK